MRFTKMHGAGNDFIILNNMDAAITEEELSGLARRLCTRRLSLGADGMMAVMPAQKGGDYRMLFYNADGSLGEMCGNGARCIARYGYENGLAGEIQRIETTAGLVTGRRVEKALYEVRLNDPSVCELSRPAQADGKTWNTAYVELGNPGIPHAVLQLDNWDELPEEELRSLGRSLRYAAAFSKGANVTFWKAVGNDQVKVRTYERGVEDFTLACGTGCGSTAAVLHLLGICSQSLRLDCPGGTLYVKLSKDADSVRDIYLTGPAVIVAEGEIGEV